MTVSKPQARKKIKKLIEKYERVKKAKQLRRYDEANTRKDFIMPLFQALGWDTYNEFTDREVVEEETAVKGKVDYSFRLHNIPQFLLEAKRLREDLDKIEWAKQAVTYGWNKGIPWVVLTDFEGLKLFNSEWLVETPRPNLEFTYNEFLSHLDDLWFLSKTSIEKGELDKQAEKWGIKAKRLKVSDKLATDLLKWRGLLYNVFRKFNEGKSEEDINESVQRVLDRLIFIRVCEDRQLEEKILWQALQKWITKGRKPDNFMKELKPIFEKFDKEYNSNLFQPHLCEKLDCYGEPFEKIIDDLYADKEKGVKYDFSAIPADVLGSIYEQYLGFVQGKGLVNGTKRKKQGIYYTPAHIVDYIVQSTLGVALKEKSLKEIENIKILDPACGSGSFLIKAFALLDEKLAEEKAQEKSGPKAFFRKYNILKNNIYGVDLDSQAIEIARLNLLLKALEPNYKLPLLSDNTKVGNSLVFSQPKTLRKYFGKDWKKQKPFDWQEEFPEVFSDGGFDVIIGNPPWVSLKGKHKSLSLPDKAIEYFVKELNVNSYAPNLYEAFIWRSLSLLRKNGIFSFIVPDRLCSNRQFVKLREHILRNFTLKKLWFRVDFPGVIADTVIFVIKNAKPQTDNKIEVAEYPNQKFSEIPQKLFLSQSDFSFFYVKEKIFKLFKKISSHSGVRPLKTVANATSGCGAKSSLLHKERKSNKEIRLIKGGNIGRYQEKGWYWFKFIDENLTGRTRDKSRLGVKEKILLRKTGIDIIATFNDSGIYPEQSLYFIYGPSKDTLLYLLAIINSRLMNIYYQNFAVTNRDTTPQLKNIHLDEFPIAEGNSIAKNKLTNLAQQMLNLNEDLQKCPEDSDRYRIIQSKIEKVDKQIDQLVYKLYSLTPEEIEVVEGK